MLQVREQDEVETVVRAHAGWVHACARRRVGDEATAQDVTQAVFILFWRKRGRLGEEVKLTVWLYRAVRYCAADALRLKRIRERHEREAAMAGLRGRAAGEARWSEVSPELERAVDRLGETYRAAVLLRFYRQMSFAEVGQALGISEGAAQKRVDRAVGKLRERLAARGVEAETVALSGLLLAHAGEGGVQGLVERIVAGVANGMGNGTAGAIAEGAMRMMAMAKAKVVAAVVAMLVAGGTTALVAKTSTTAVSTATRPATAAAAPTNVVRRKQLDQKAATDTANEFLKALRDRSAEQLAALVAGESPEAQLATAKRYIAEIRDREYARFPKRLGSIVGTMASSSREGALLSVRFEVNSPIDAETRRLSLTLTPGDGRWLVSAATMPLAGSIRKGPELAAQPEPKPAPPGAYAKAFQILVAFHQTARALDPSQKPDRQAAADGISKATAQMEELAAALKGTDLEWPGSVMQRAKPALEKMRQILLERGVEALVEIAQGPDKPLKDVEEPFDRIRRLEIELPQRIDAEDALTKRTPRPVAYGLPIEVTLGWNGQKQTFPGPVELPPWFRQSAAYRGWQERRSGETFSTTDDTGNRYEISMMGRSREADGSLHDMISSINVYRPDGTLAATSSVYNDDRPMFWGIMDKTGTRYICSVTVFGGDDDRRVSFFADDGSQRIWTVNRQNRVLMEKTANPIGEESHVTNE